MELFHGKYKGCEKVTLNNTVIVFANQLPNLDRLSLDRWVFFHTKLGPVGVNCIGHADDYYACTIDKENEISSIKTCHQNPLPKKDSDAYQEYLDNYNVPRNLRLTAVNRLAFPNATSHSGMILRLF
ncbi:Uncharacterized protein APZ42_009864, partial [Daphnia magna]